MSDYSDTANYMRLAEQSHDNLFQRRALSKGADELARLRSKYEALRAKYATVTALADDLADGVTADLNATTQKQQNAADHKLFDAHEDYLVFRENNPDNESQAWLLRKQAEAVKAFVAQFPRLTQKGRDAHGDLTVARETLEREAQRLLDQATDQEKRDE